MCTDETTLGKYSADNQLDIIEVFPETKTTRRSVTFTPRPKPRKVAKTTKRVTTIAPIVTTERVREILSQKGDTSEHDLKTFFGDYDEQIDGQDDDAGKIFSPASIVDNKFDDGLKSSQGFNDVISQDQRPGNVNDNSVLGLFEMMGKINKEAASNAN